MRQLSSVSLAVTRKLLKQSAAIQALRSRPDHASATHYVLGGLASALQQPGKESGFVDPLVASASHSSGRTTVWVCASEGKNLRWRTSTEYFLQFDRILAKRCATALPLGDTLAQVRALCLCLTRTQRFDAGVARVHSKKCSLIFRLIVRGT